MSRDYKRHLVFIKSTLILKHRIYRIYVYLEKRQVKVKTFATVIFLNGFFKCLPFTFMMNPTNSMVGFAFNDHMAAVSEALCSVPVAPHRRVVLFSSRSFLRGAAWGAAWGAASLMLRSSVPSLQDARCLPAGLLADKLPDVRECAISVHSDEKSALAFALRSRIFLVSFKNIFVSSPFTMGA